MSTITNACSNDLEQKIYLKKVRYERHVSVTQKVKQKRPKKEAGKPCETPDSNATLGCTAVPTPNSTRIGRPGIPPVVGVWFDGY